MEKLLEFIDLTRRFDRNDYCLQISGSLEEGDILAVRGPSGSGKSTLLKMLARLLAPESGRILYQGKDYCSISPLSWRREIQYLSQKPVIFAGTVEENLRIPFSLSSVQALQSYPEDLAAACMEELSLPEELLKQEAGTLSGGEAARIALIRSLLIQPRLLLLDEPTAYLDEKNAVQLLQMLQTWVKQPNRGLIIVSHKQDEINEMSGVKFLDIQVREAAR